MPPTGTYTPGGPGRDYIRLLIGDTKVSPSPLLWDEEIDEVTSKEAARYGLAIADEAALYFSAASCLEIIIIKFASKGKGLKSVNISGLAISQGIDSASAGSLQEMADGYKLKAQQLLSSEKKRSRRFAAIGEGRRYGCGGLY
jgi:hypothetical protein